MTEFEKVSDLPHYIKQIDDNENYISVNLCVNETALCLNGNFFILIGDYRVDLNNLNNLKEIKNFFKNKHDKISGRSDPFEII